MLAKMGEAMTDSAWIKAMRALLPGADPIVPVFYTEEAWKQARVFHAIPTHGIDRAKTIEHFETSLDVRVPEELRK